MGCMPPTLVCSSSSPAPDGISVWLVGGSWLSGTAAPWSARWRSSAAHSSSYGIMGPPSGTKLSRLDRPAQLDRRAVPHQLHLQRRRAAQRLPHLGELVRLLDGAAVDALNDV